MVFVSGTGIAGAFHKWLWFYVVLSQAVDDDMHMDIAALVVSVRVGADKSLMSGKIFAGIFQTKLLRPLPGQTVL